MRICYWANTLSGQSYSYCALVFITSLFPVSQNVFNVMEKTNERLLGSTTRVDSTQIEPRTGQVTGSGKNSNEKNVV